MPGKPVVYRFQRSILAAQESAPMVAAVLFAPGLDHALLGLDSDCLAVYLIRAVFYYENDLVIRHPERL